MLGRGVDFSRRPPDKRAAVLVFGYARHKNVACRNGLTDLHKYIAVCDLYCGYNAVGRSDEVAGTAVGFFGADAFGNVDGSPCPLNVDRRPCNAVDLERKTRPEHLGIDRAYGNALVQSKL